MFAIEITLACLWKMDSVVEVCSGLEVVTRPQSGECFVDVNFELTLTQKSLRFPGFSPPFYFVFVYTLSSPGSLSHSLPFFCAELLDS